MTKRRIRNNRFVADNRDYVAEAWDEGDRAIRVPIDLEEDSECSP